MVFRALVAVASSCALLCLSAAASAAPIVAFDYTAMDEFGASVTGIFGYDLGVADTNAQAEIGLYPGSGFITGTVTGGHQDGAVFEVSGLDWVVLAGSAIHTLGVLESPTFVFLEDPTSTTFPDDSLPLELDLSDFVDPLLALHGDDIGLPTIGQVFYPITSISTHVPEPSTLALLGAGLFACGLRRRRVGRGGPGQRVSA